ncbi:hypothetical protein Vafri_6299 [Volvox africanus]|uniref:Uncharacterized protein n=1 Tax=Volvox africanus TaxID=51714 RepID=A0A8J4AXZ9_9CHLO|nr:hypothetical protein Vafri_6299 [Volvox africanus]
MSRKSSILGCSTCRVEVGKPYNSRAHKDNPWLMTSTMIKEEDEEDLVEISSAKTLTPSALHPIRTLESGNGQTKADVPGSSYAAIWGCKVSRLAVLAVSNVSKATTKLLNQIRRSGHSYGQQYPCLCSGFPELGNQAVDSAIPTAASAADVAVNAPSPAPAPSLAPEVRSSCITAAIDKSSRQSGAATTATASQRKAHTVGKHCKHQHHQHQHHQHQHHQHQHHQHQHHQHQHHQHQHHDTHVNQRNHYHLRHLHPERDAQQIPVRRLKQLQNHHFQEPQPQPPRGSHLVRLMDGDDVRLAMQALQLAAHIHDHVWGPGGDPACTREALLDAASPLYDTAMAVARAIQHRALHALVKQAVRRYVNPCRGSPDDVLRVILELLTGCGVEAVLAQAQAQAQAQAEPLKCADGRPHQEVNGVPPISRSRVGDGVNDRACWSLAVVAADGKPATAVPQQQVPTPLISTVETSSPSLDCGGDGAGSCGGVGTWSSGPRCSTIGTTESFTSLWSSGGSNSLSTGDFPRSLTPSSRKTNV